MEEEIQAKNKETMQKFKQELLVTGFSPNTIETYTEYVRHFLEFVKKTPEKIERDDIISFLAFMKEKRDSSNATLALILSSLKFFFHNFLHKKIVEDIKVPKKAKRLPTVLTKEEVKALIKAVPAGRDRLIVEFLYSSGVRVSEAAKLKINDLEFEERIGKIRGGKGNKDRIIILSQKWIENLKQHLRARETPSEYVFTKKNGKPISADTIQRIIRTAREKAGIKRQVTPHVLRHSFSTHLLESGENIRKIQELLGHANLSTTQIYVHVATSELKKVKSPFDNM